MSGFFVELIPVQASTQESDNNDHSSIICNTVACCDCM